MKRIAFTAAVLLVAFSFVGLTGQAPAPASHAREAEEIVRLLREWGDAMARRDATRKRLGRLLADDFTFVSPRGRLMKKAVYVANRDASGGFCERVGALRRCLGASLWRIRSRDKVPCRRGVQQ